MRAFIALDLPDDLRIETAHLARGLARSVEGRFVPFENYHLTLAFLGDVAEAEAREAVALLDEVARSCDAPVLDPVGLGAFGRSGAKTLVMDVHPTEALVALVRAVRMGLDERGIAYDEKPFRPHVTLARRARIPRSPLPDLVFPAPAAAPRVTLYKSILSSAGARYKALYTVDLAVAHAHGSPCTSSRLG